MVLTTIAALAFSVKLFSSKYSLTLCLTVRLNSWSILLLKVIFSTLKRLLHCQILDCNSKDN